MQYVPLGASLALSCQYEAVPPPDLIEWKHNGSLLLDSDPLIVISLDPAMSNLFHAALTEVSGGLYTCIVSNSAGSQSVQINVLIQRMCGLLLFV